MEASYKFVNKGVGSFAIKFGTFSLDERILPVTVVSTIPTKVDHSYHISGGYLKTGWLFYTDLDYDFFLSHGLYLVTSRANHTYSRTVSNQWDSYSISRNAIYYGVGGEYEFTAGLRVLQNFLMSASLQTGYKPMNVYLFEDLVKGMPAYTSYTPGQGYSPWPFYVSLSAGMSFVF